MKNIFYAINSILQSKLKRNKLIFLFDHRPFSRDWYNSQCLADGLKSQRLEAVLLPLQTSLILSIIFRPDGIHIQGTTGSGFNARSASLLRRLNFHIFSSMSEKHNESCLKDLSHQKYKKAITAWDHNIDRLDAYFTWTKDDKRIYEKAYKKKLKNLYDVGSLNTDLAIQKKFLFNKKSHNNIKKDKLNVLIVGWIFPDNFSDSKAKNISLNKEEFKDLMIHKQKFSRLMSSLLTNESINKIYVRPHPQIEDKKIASFISVTEEFLTNKRVYIEGNNSIYDSILKVDFALMYYSTTLGQSALLEIPSFCCFAHEHNANIRKKLEIVDEWIPKKNSISSKEELEDIIDKIKNDNEYCELIIKENIKLYEKYLGKADGKTSQRTSKIISNIINTPTYYKKYDEPINIKNIFKDFLNIFLRELKSIIVMLIYLFFPFLVPSKRNFAKGLYEWIQYFLSKAR